MSGRRLALVEEPLRFRGGERPVACLGLHEVGSARNQVGALSDDEHGVTQRVAPPLPP